MNQREKTLLIAIGAVAVVVICTRMVYPKWVRPMFDFDAEIARKQTELDDLEFEISRMDSAREVYREYVYRTGGTNPEEVGDQCTSTLIELLDQCRLKDRQVSPKGSSTDRKTGLTTLSYSIRGEGPLQQAVLFLKGFYEMPYMARFKSLKLVPQKRRRRTRRGTRNLPTDEVKLTGSIDVLVPPTFFGEIPEEDLLENRATRLVKYHTDDYALIWEMEPFLRPEPEREVVHVEPEREPESEPEPEPATYGWTPDPFRDQKVLSYPMAAINQVMVVDGASKAREYVRVGEQLDGGDLIMVHPYGALVRRREGPRTREYLYPLGELLADAVALNEAVSEPQLRAVAYHFLAEEETRAKAARVPGDLAGPPIELAGSPADEEAAAPEVSESSDDSVEPLTGTELTGPPRELAEPDPEREGASAGESPSPIEPVRDGPARGAEEESSVPNREAL